MAEREVLTEAMRKQYLKEMEDQRIIFAEKLDKEGFRPERMIFFSTEDGRCVALAKHAGKYAVIVTPVFSKGGDFVIEYFDELQYEREEIYEKGTGLNGAFGFGTKGANGYKLHITMGDGSTVPLCVVAGRTSWLETVYKKNPLLKTKRRRGNANVMWDLFPIDGNRMSKINEALDGYYLA